MRVADPTIRVQPGSPSTVPERRVRSFDDVTRQLRESILSGSVRPGERLPGERELCETFGVSRPTLREALRSLEALGIVEVHAGRGGGTYAIAPSLTTLGDALATLVNFRGASAQDLAEFRASFEAESARWAARRADDADIATLHGIIEELRVVAKDTEGWQQVGEIDARWHEAVARATKNRLRIGISLGIHEAVMRNVSLLQPAVRRYARSIRPELIEVTKRIQERDGEAAQQAMGRHIDRWNRLNRGVTLEPRDTRGVPPAEG
jgi:GntR family transcriptional repressor for pyruvate dehydrogenase complex